MVYFKEKYNFPRFQSGSDIFQGGPTFSSGEGGGSNCLFPIETPITCDFPRGGGVTPHWIRTWQFQLPKNMSRCEVCGRYHMTTARSATASHFCSWFLRGDLQCSPIQCSLYPYILCISCMMCFVRPVCSLSDATCE